MLGPKTDDWVGYTVGGLRVSAGWVQLTAQDSRDAHHLARRLGLGTALTLLMIDLIYPPAARRAVSGFTS